MSSDFTTTTWTIIEAAGRQEADALEWLADRYYSPLRHVLRAFLNQSARDFDIEELLEEVLQATFVKLIEDQNLLNRADRHHGAKFRSYLSGVAINIARNEIAKRRRARKPSGKHHLVSLEQEGVEAPNAPIEDTTQAWASGLMQRAFEAVRQHCRESGRDEVTTVLARTAFDGLKPSAIAEEHQWAVERVYEWLRSGKGLLKREVLNAIREYSLEDDVPQELQTLFASSGILNDDTN